VSAAAAVDEFLELRWPGYRPFLDGALPEAFEQAVADSGAWFEADVPGLLEWSFGEAEARRITRPVLSVLGGESEALWPRFGEAHRLLLESLPNAEGFVLPGTTHLMLLQNPRALAEALGASFARHPLDPADVGGAASG
jgi:pimeloyl-ACP methyl ester carboxylesterase